MKRIGLVFLFCCWLLSPTLCLAALALESVTPNQGVMGQDLPVKLKGSGFDANTRVSMTLDVGNKKAITGSVDTAFAYDVTVVGSTAYVADNLSGLQIIDISNPKQPMVIGSVATSSKAHGVTVVGSTAYVAENHNPNPGGILQVIDVSNPKQPMIIGSVDTPDWAVDVTVVGSTAYVATQNSTDWEGSLQVIDVSNPKQPMIIGSVDTTGTAEGVTVVGSTAYVAVSNVPGGILQLIDVSNPKQPMVISSVATSSGAYGVTVMGSTAYVTEGWGLLQVIDVSNPKQPMIIGSVDTPDWPHGVTVVGSTVYVADGGCGLEVIDVSNPQQPIIIGSVNTPGYAFSVTVVGSTAYVADASGLRVIDVSNPKQSTSIGSVDTPGSAYDVTVVGSTAYVADNFSGLQIIDVSNPKQPMIIGSVDTTGAARGVTVVGSTAYVADNFSGLQIIDISNPKQPMIIGSVDTTGAAEGVTVVGSTGYVADGTGGLQVIDVSNPKQPMIIGSVDTTGTARGVTVVGSTAYVTNFEGGLRVIDVSNPKQPMIIGSMDIPGNLRGVMVVGSTAYIAAGGWGLQVIDVSNPKQPAIIGSVATLGSAEVVTVVGSTAYVANYSGGLQVFDLSNPKQPLPVGSVDTLGPAEGFMVVGSLAYVAGMGVGLSIVPLPQEIKPLNMADANTLTLTLPSPLIAGNYNIRIFNDADDYSELPGAVNFAKLDFSSLDLNLLDIRTISGDMPPSDLTIGEITALQLIYKTPTGIPINLSNLSGQVSLQWLSSNPEVLSISPVGIVAAQGQGTAMITANVPGGRKAITIEVTTPTPIEKANDYGNLIVIAGRNAVDEELGQTFQALANMAYETFNKRGLEHDDIEYINAYGPQTIPGDSVDVVDIVLDTTSTNGSAIIINAITIWAASQYNTGPLYLYLVDHGGKQSIKLTPKSILTASQLKVALDQFQSDTGRKVVVMIEACFSGSWKDTLTSIDRLVLTSTGDNAELLPSEGVANTFSDYFFKGVSKGKSIEKAYNYAVTGVQSTAMGKNQSPLSGVGDADLWASYVVGPWASAASFALFSDYTGVNGPLQCKTGEGLNLSSTLDVINKDWVEAYAILTPPVPSDTVVNEFETPALIQIKVPLTYTGEVGEKDYFGSGNKVFEGVSDPFTLPGEWELTYVVKDQNGELTVSNPVAVSVSGNGYEPTTTTTSTSSTSSTTTTTIPGSQSVTLQAGSGWSLLSSTIGFYVQPVFGDSVKYTSVWKWQSGNWAVSLPGENPAGLYASSKGFGNLTAVNPGEGFWVNSKSSQEITIGGTPVYESLSFTSGWNLVGLKSATASSVADIVNAQSGIISMWNWVNGNWAVYLPGEANPGAYASSKGFAVMSTINPGEGFWVNKP